MITFFFYHLADMVGKHSVRSRRRRIGRRRKRQAEVYVNFDELDKKQTFQGNNQFRLVMPICD